MLRYGLIRENRVSWRDNVFENFTIFNIIFQIKKRNTLLPDSNDFGHPREEVSYNLPVLVEILHQYNGQYLDMLHLQYFFLKIRLHHFSSIRLNREKYLFREYCQVAV